MSPAFNTVTLQYIEIDRCVCFLNQGFLLLNDDCLYIKYSMRPNQNVPFHVVSETESPYYEIFASNPHAGEHNTVTQ